MREYIPPENRLILDFFYEVFCPFCRRVRLNIIDKLRTKHIVTVNLIDVDSNTGSLEMSWYRSFCKEVKEEPTPLLRLHDSLMGDSSWDYAFLMWKKKPTTLTEEILKAEEILEKQLYDNIRLHQKSVVFPVQPSYELDRDVFFTTVHKLSLKSGVVLTVYGGVRVV